jgi:hypothetical protein
MGIAELRGWPWRSALSDRRLVGLLAVAVATSLVVAVTPLSARAWPLLAWGVLVYVAGASAFAWTWSAPDAPAPAAPPPTVGGTDITRGDPAIRAVAEALQKLNNPAALGECALAGLLPCTLAVSLSRDGDDSRASRHQVVRSVLIDAIERLKPPDSAGPGEQTLYFAILREEYVLGHPVPQILIRRSISESTFHRYRRDATRAVARDLVSREQACASRRP